MASSSSSSCVRREENDTERCFWTEKQNKVFEKALAKYEEDTPERWEEVAREVGGGKSAQEVQRHYQILLHDLSNIESGLVPIPNYKSSSPSSVLDHQDGLLKHPILN
ncbi:hypothetical protein QN277_005070 [Acacia crassicarpa]|uniref:Myb-like domain-containing protein n=1 Tax=Acacia crassicarpa TaxID=499986 RepID=A0AAE1MAQ1_9FABA|nr:hypothetical protein QN277_005070 [Acacia crassicarpa]